MKRQHADAPFDSSTIATPEEVADFEKSRSGEHCCSAEEFRVDISKGARNKWNKSAAIVFARAFVESGDYDHEDEQQISEAFLTHLRTLRRKFREQGLTTVQVRDRQKKANRDQRKVTVSGLPMRAFC